MSGETVKQPTVLCFAGLDPTGGAGLQADIEAVGNLGGHALPVLTAVTAQDTRDVRSCTPVGALSIIEQARVVLEDIRVDAFKVGLVGSVEAIGAIHTILKDYEGVPVVVDPVCTSAAGTPLADEEQMDALVSLLLPLATMVTPNTIEARLLTPEADTLGASAQELLSYGCRFVLLTGSHEPSPTIVHRLYSEHRLIESFECERLPGEYHGSGCTLSAAIAVLLGHGLEPLAAAAEALEYTFEALRNASALGHGQLIPQRLFRSRGAGS
ncbi:MAG: hydroxymethylpyrimidine/phosphomethylpyrimidine kinase [Gammaproteobacteria bacterium]|nr:hydroxymethylpyrimidine/phosphomethylpyrimidine kinase [Gammaproteobacteria bacterium]NIM72537.1 hydroxymethylpyrimidine/phosphomethylpyrimidine kinase [Gammaproteobacteria bacterium]NIN37550.1 hydroxymethylpyrimidine/phosphomethylpyrimidine kinase [Gammaproteobacteria bacterium]NIO24296.1 hydroxymethylpyrimidine/phosphomethylpyrimidine kinase [Gammaproteobacteria bacterium]NIO64901.1 hydroxymethylpyrimidine/phosphomethylpyrimidine kinase [Gammaproteobacteria bacterium]